jgi:hypothetical protein
VAMVEMCTRLAIERARTVTLHLQQARRSSIPTNLRLAHLPLNGFSWRASRGLADKLRGNLLQIADRGLHLSRRGVSQPLVTLSTAEITTRG